MSNSRFFRHRLVRLAFCINLCMSFISTGNLLSQQEKTNVERRIDSILYYFSDNSFPGLSIAVIKDGNTLFKKSYGLADVKTGTKINENTNFRLASVSKQFTAMCIMILKEQGKLKYETTLKEIFPDFPDYGRSINVKNLLQHTSGLIDYEDIMPDTATQQVYDRDVLKMMKSIDTTYFLPGSAYKYSNSGYALLAMIVEKISGKRYPDFLYENIFKKIGMSGTVAFEKGISTVKNRAYGYVVKNKNIIERDQSTTSAVLGDGGIYSSVSDLIKWDAALYTEKIVKKSTLDEAFSTGMLNSGKRTGYGYGWMTGSAQGVKYLEHGGSTCGFTNHILRIPELKFTIIILTNRYGVAELPEITRNIADIFTANLFGSAVNIRTGKNDTLKMIEGYETLIGLKFKSADRDSMYEAVRDYIRNYEKIRSLNISNSTMPSLLFNPLPKGFDFPKSKSSLIISEYNKTELPINKDDLAFYSIGELASLIKRKKISSVDLTAFFIERLKKYSSQLKCLVTLTEDLALMQAKKADEELSLGIYRGLLHGIPYGVKDLLATKKYKTTWGSVPFKDQLIKEDATVIKKLEAAGAVLVAKLSMGELAWGDVWFGGKTRNPWDTTKGSSGSSAGSASATAAGLVPFAIGTETYGSIVSPSTVCGVTGLRPTYGRVSRAGAMALSWSMDKIGPICRNSEDCAIVFSVIQGMDVNDPTLYDAPFSYDGSFDFSKLKIGYLKNNFESQYAFKKYDSLTLETMKKLGAILIPVELPDFPVSDISIMLDAEAAAAFDDLTRSGKDALMVRQIKNAWPNAFRTARFIPAVEYINASRARTILIEKMKNIFSEVDMYLAPSFEGDNLLLTNLTGHPCVVFPNGFADGGLPQSITLIGNLFDESSILKVVKRYQDVTDFHIKHPKLK